MRVFGFEARSFGITPYFRLSDAVLNWLNLEFLRDERFHFCIYCYCFGLKLSSDRHQKRKTLHEKRVAGGAQNRYHLNLEHFV
jgi:hypothetical protein